MNTDTSNTIDYPGTQQTGIGESDIVTDHTDLCKLYGSTCLYLIHIYNPKIKDKTNKTLFYNLYEYENCVHNITWR